MSDTQPLETASAESTTPAVDAPQAGASAVFYLGEKPHWDFTGDVAFPVQMSDEFTIYPRFSPYKKADLLNALTKVAKTAGYKREKGSLKLVREDVSQYQSLCMDNFVCVYGTDSDDPDVQKQWLGSKPDVQVGFIKYGFGALAKTDDSDDSEDTGKFSITKAVNGEIDVNQTLYDFVNDKEVRIDMTHRYNLPSEAHYRRFNSARTELYLRKKQMWTVSEDRNQLIKLYDELVVSVDGGAYNGVACNAENKTDWIDGVPAWHKLLVVDQIFEEVVGKNE